MPNPTIRPANEIQRLRALKDYQVIDTPPEERFDDLTRLASQICEMPIALISLVESHRQWFKSKVGVTVQESLRNGAFCAHTILQSDLFIVPDALDDIRFLDNPFVIQPPNIRFYAGAPLQNSEGYTLGSLCVLDFKPRELTEQQKDALRVLSRQVVAQLELRRSTLKKKHNRIPSLSPIDEYEGNVRLLMDSTGEGIYGLDLEGNCTFCNPACLRMLGYDAREELYGKNMHTLIHHTNQDGSDSPVEECKVWQSFQTGMGIHVDDEILWRRDGTSFQAEYWSYPVRREGDLVGSVVTFVDITERKQAEMDLLERNHMLALDAEVGHVLSQNQELQVLLQGCTEALVRHLDATFARIWTLNATEQVLELQASAGLYTHLNGSHARVPVGQLKIGKIASEKKPHLTNAVIGDPRVPEQEWAKQAGLVAFAGFPLLRNQEILGVMGMFSQHPLTDFTLNSLEMVASHITTAIEREIANEAYLKSARHSEQILASAGEGIYGLDLECKVTFVNPAGAKILGYEAEELIGLSTHTAVHHTNSNPSRHSKEMCPMCATLKSGSVHHVENEALWRKDATSFPAEYTCTPIQEDGRLTGAVVTFQDITARKQAEEALQELNIALTLATPGISLLDSEGCYQQVNEVYANLLGYLPDDLIGQNWKCTVDPDDHAIALSAFEDMRTSGKGEFEARAIRKDGSVFHKHVVMVKRINKAENADQHHCLMRDITERKQMEQALREKDRELQQAQRMETIGTLAGGIAHDFNNILSGIFGFTELALKTIPENEQLHAYLEQVLAAASRAKDLVKQILAFSRNVEIVRRPTDLHLLLKEVLNFLRATLPSSIEIKEHIPSNLGIINADPTQIYQVIINLCANAEFAMREIGGVLEIHLEMIEVSKELHAMHPQLKLECPHLSVTVQDTGQGMSPDVQKRIFDPFFTTKAVGEGAGMGLSVVHGIIASHGGAITVNSQLGHGTAFAIYLPNIDSEVIPPVQGDIPIEKGRGNILLVEDEESLADLGKVMIEQLGYMVEVHTSSVSALESFKNSPQKFDVVMSDQTMPTLTGEGLAQKLLEVRPDLPIVLCTGYSHTMTPEKAKAMGIGAFLMKPFQMRELATILHEVLRNHPQQHE